MTTDGTDGLLGALRVAAVVASTLLDLLGDDAEARLVHMS